LGNNYLEYLKNLPKKKTNVNSSERSLDKRNSKSTDPTKKMMKKDAIEKYVKEINPLYNSNRKSESL
jgi:hypothetical protein